MIAKIWLAPVTYFYRVIFEIMRICGALRRYEQNYDDSIKGVRYYIIQEHTLLYKMFGHRYGGAAFWGENVLFYREPESRLFYHEHKHVLQQYVFGVFFVTCYIAAGLFEVAMGNHFYYANLFEIQAREYARLRCEQE